MDTKSIWSTIVALFLTSASQGADLTVTVIGLKGQDGLLSVSLFDSEEAWNDDTKMIEAEQVEVDAETEIVIFDDLPPGIYSIRLMHDENSNGKLDTNIFGVPKEGWGYSNNPRAMGRAKWDQAAFELGTEDRAITINVR